ncbi:MAG: hypothetical protein RSF36_04250 [Cetobacterium sp.]
MNSVKEALRGDIVKKLDKSTYTGNAQNLKNDIDGKEPTFSKNSAFNKSFGVANNEVLEGAKLAETLGIEYGGILNNNSTKIAGKAYYCTANRSIYKCTSNTTLNYTDAGYFIAISNDDLLGKLQNLVDTRIAVYDLAYGITVVENKFSFEITIDTKEAIPDLTAISYPSGLKLEHSKIVLVTYSDNGTENNNGAIRFLSTNAYTLTPIKSNNVGYLYINKRRF